MNLRQKRERTKLLAMGRDNLLLYVFDGHELMLN